MSDKPLTDKDREVRELTATDFANMRHITDVLPDLVAAQNNNSFKTRGQPVSENKKVPVTIRLSSEVVDHFKSTGKGWQTRLNEVLQQHINNP